MGPRTPEKICIDYLYDPAPGATPSRGFRVLFRGFLNGVITVELWWVPLGLPKYEYVYRN
jgi:hypothetical protein